MTTHRLRLEFLVPLLAAISTARAQDILYEHPSLNPYRLAAVGDIDGDGKADFAVGSPYDGRGKVRVLSSATQTILRTFVGDLQARRLGFCIAALGDVDLDGVPDLAASAEGAVRVLSLGTGQVLFTIPGLTTDRFGYAICAAGDVDGDGHADFAIGAPQVFVSGGGDHYTIQSSGPGFVEIRSGANGTVLRTLLGPNNASGFGGSIADGGDLDGDGVNDLLVSQFVEPVLPGSAEKLRAFSGASGALLLQVPLLGWGARVTALGDVDADGAHDFALLERPLGVRVVSGATGAALYTLQGVGPTDGFGEAMCGIDDFDGDGSPDLFVGAPQQFLAGFQYLPGPGYAQIVSGGSGAVLETLVGNAVDQPFGWALSGIGDIDGDGRGELVAAQSSTIRVYSSRKGFSAPTNYCIGDYNLVGQASISHFGSPSIAANQWTLTLNGADPGKLAVLFVGSSASVKHFSPTNQPGYLCVGGPSMRLGPAQVISPQGTAQRSVNLAPGSPFTLGSTWYFQFAYYNNPANRNTSDALAVTFTP